MTIVHDVDQNNKNAQALRDRGCELTAAKHRQEITTCQLRFVKHLLAAGTGTIDDADDTTAHDQKFIEKRGNWRGAAVRELASRGIIEPTGERRRSRRPSRHATENREWRIKNTTLARSLLATLTP